MERSVEIPSEGDPLQLVLSGFGIRCYTFDTNPAHVNPDFLRFNGIALADWAIVRPVVVGPQYSRVNYNNGLSVVAADDHISFNQINLIDQNVDVIIPQFAMRYLEASPENLTFGSISLNPMCLISRPCRPKSSDSDRNPLARQLAVRYRDMEPEVAIRLQYRFPSERVVITVSERPVNSDCEYKSVRVNGQFHFSAEGDYTGSSFARGVVERSELIIAEFLGLAKSMCSRYLDSGAR